MQLTADVRDTILANLIAADAIFDPAAVFIGVGTAVANNGLNTVLGDITQATGAMATRHAIAAWSAVFVLTNQCAVVNGPLVTFHPASSTEAQTLAVWFLASAITAGNLLAFGNIAPGVPLPDEFASWSIVPRITVDPNGIWSAEITFNG